MKPVGACRRQARNGREAHRRFGRIDRACPPRASDRRWPAAPCPSSPSCGNERGAHSPSRAAASDWRRACPCRSSAPPGQAGGAAGVVREAADGRRHAACCRCNSGAHWRAAECPCPPTVPTKAGESFRPQTSAAPKCSTTFGQVLARGAAIENAGGGQDRARSSDVAQVCVPSLRRLVELRDAVGHGEAEVQRDALAGDDRPGAVVHLAALPRPG